MSTTTPADRTLSPARSVPARPAPPRLRPLDILILSAWCGLAGGLLEVAARVVGKRLLASNRLYLMSRHFVWLVPLSNLMFFAVLGVFLALAATIWRRFGPVAGPAAHRLPGDLPVLIVLGPRIYQSAWMLLAIGAALRLAPILERHATTGLRRRLLLDVPRPARRGPDPVRLARRGPMAGRASRGRPAVARRQSAERDPDHAGYRAGPTT